MTNTKKSAAALVRSESMAKQLTEKVEIIRPTVVNGETVDPQVRDEKTGRPTGKIKPVLVAVPVREAVLLENLKKCRRPNKVSDDDFDPAREPKKQPAAG